MMYDNESAVATGSTEVSDVAESSSSLEATENDELYEENTEYYRDLVDNHTSNYESELFEPSSSLNIRDSLKAADSDHNWEYTSLSHDEELVIKDMIDKGELEEPSTTTDEPEHRKPLIPTDSGRFEGENGNSEFYPDNVEAQAKIREFGKKSVTYSNGYPDFSPFTEHETRWGKIGCQVEIGHMTEHRENPSFEYGHRPRGAGHDPNYDLGNFAQADNELLSKVKMDHPDATLDDIEDLKKTNKLTWHECEDGKTMQLVPTEIHQACKHSGGVSESKYRAEMGDVDRWDY